MFFILNNDFLRVVNWEALTTCGGQVDDDGVAATILIISIEGKFDRGCDVISGNGYGGRGCYSSVSGSVGTCPKLQLIKTGVLQDQIFTT